MTRCLVGLVVFKGCSGSYWVSFPWLLKGSQSGEEFILKGKLIHEILAKQMCLWWCLLLRLGVASSDFGAESGEK